MERLERSKRFVLVAHNSLWVRHGTQFHANYEIKTQEGRVGWKVPIALRQRDIVPITSKINCSMKQGLKVIRQEKHCDKKYPAGLK